MQQANELPSPAVQSVRISEQEQLLAEYAATVERYDNEVESQKEKKERALQQWYDEQQKTSDLMAIKGSLDELTKQQDDLIVNQRIKISELEASIEYLEIQLIDAKKSLETPEKPKQKIANLKKQHDDKTQRLQKIITVLAQKLEQQSKTLVEKDRQIESQKSTIDDLDESVKEHLDTIRSYKDALDDEEEKNKQYQAKIYAVEQQLRADINTIKSKDATIESLETMLKLAEHSLALKDQQLAAQTATPAASDSLALKDQQLAAQTATPAASGWFSQSFFGIKAVKQATNNTQTIYIEGVDPVNNSV